MRAGYQNSLLAPFLEVMFALLIFMPGSSLSAPQSDARRLNEGLPAEFRRTPVHLHPLLDLRPLLSPIEVKGAAPAPAFEIFVEELVARKNLLVSLPANVRARARSKPGFAEKLAFARSQAALGLEDFKQVRLDATIRHLREAAELYAQLDHQLDDPRSVARIELTRGLALLEKTEVADAGPAFVAALRADPRIRLRPDFDRAESIAALERARLDLLDELRKVPAVPPSVLEDARRLGVYIVRSRLVPATTDHPESIEATIVSPTGSVTQETEALDRPDAPSRLASRVWACLPFGQEPSTRRTARDLARVDVGYAYFIFAENPLEVFGNVGAALDVSYLLAKNMSMELGLQLTNSGRDREEHLRVDVLTFRGLVGAGAHFEAGPFRFESHLGGEVASIGRVITTTDSACKHFVPEDGRGYDGCPPSSVDATEGAIVAGIGLTAGASVNLVDDLYFALRFSGSEYFFETTELDLGRPIGATAGLGYRFR